MRLKWTGLRRLPVPDNVRPALGGDKALEWDVDLESKAIIVAGTEQVYAVAPDGEVLLARPWHLVDTGSWDRDASALTVSWVDRAPTRRWVFDLMTEFPEVFRARVQASVVLAETLEVGDRGAVRVVVRKNLADQSLLTQAILGRGVRSSDPGVAEVVQSALARVREQVGLD